MNVSEKLLDSSTATNFIKQNRKIFIYFESFFRRSSGKVDEDDTTGVLYIFLENDFCQLFLNIVDYF
jgi:hypothetical protein